MMNACETVLDRLPDRVADRLPAAEAARVDAHLDGCPACREEAELLARLVATAPGVPEGLEARIRAAVDREFGPGAVGAPAAAPARGRRRGWWPAAVPAWGWAAAAALALFLGRGLLPGGDGLEDVGPEFVALTEVEYGVLPSGDIVAGAPVLDGLTEEDLNQLLEEWDG